MKKNDTTLFFCLTVVSFCMILAGCESLPLKDGGLAIGKDTTAGIEDIGVGSDAGAAGRITRQF